MNLEDKLRQWRRDVASTLDIPAYRILSDSTLLGIARGRPTTITQLLGLTGVGLTTAERYGDALLDLVIHDEGLPLAEAPNPHWMDELAFQIGVGPEVFRDLPLAERTQAVLARRLGLHDGRRWTVGELAELLHAPPVKVNQLMIQGLARVVNHLLQAEQGGLVLRVLAEAAA